MNEIVNNVECFPFPLIQTWIHLILILNTTNGLSLETDGVNAVIAAFKSSGVFWRTLYTSDYAAPHR